MKHLGTKRLETDRLILRPFVIEDAEVMYRNWANDPEVTKFLTWPPHESVQVTKDLLEDWISQYKNKEFYHWTIISKENGEEPVGSISVVLKEDEIKMVHIGYCIGKRWWRQGITSEALSTLVKFFFEEVGVNRIELKHDTNNPNSGKVMMKCRLQYEGTHREGALNNQGVCDSAMYAILAKDYFAALS
jgi:ribosomal-protein-alanine N-acetyltransferase